MQNSPLHIHLKEQGLVDSIKHASVVDVIDVENSSETADNFAGNKDLPVLNGEQQKVSRRIKS